MEGPSKILLGLEGIRAIYEYGMGCLLTGDLKKNAPKGDGHPVLVLPGLGTSDTSTNFLRNFLDDLGYVSYGWDLGRNMGPRQGMDVLLGKISDRVVQIFQLSSENQLSIIGWSLGGIYGREIAKYHPELVRQVITLGTPFKNLSAADSAPAASILYELLSKDKSHRDPKILQQISEPPPVPFTSIYSKTDGVINWQASLENEGPISQNIEVPNASHLGLGHNPVSMALIADRLAQTKQNWAPYKK